MLSRIFGHNLVEFLKNMMYIDCFEQINTTPDVKKPFFCALFSFSLFWFILQDLHIIKLIMNNWSFSIYYLWFQEYGFSTGCGYLKIVFCLLIWTSKWRFRSGYFWNFGFDHWLPAFMGLSLWPKVFGSRFRLPPVDLGHLGW